MKKRIIPLFLGICAALLLSSCGTPEGNPLPEGMDETAVLDTGREIVTDLNAGSWQEVYDLMREDAKTATGSPEAVAEHMQAVLDKAGPYVSEENAMATGQKLDSGEGYATAVFYCKHKKDEVLYRIAFSTDMELLGLQVSKK